VKVADRVICTLAHGPHQALYDVTAPTLARYAKAHGYEFIGINHRLEPSRPAAWDKIVLLHELTADHELVVWIDADAVACDDAPDIADALQPRRFLHLVEHRIARGRVPNTGVIVMRGGVASRRFLDRVWSQPRTVHHEWWENAAMLRVLGYRDVGGFRPVVPTPWRLGMGLLDKAWNSIPADPALRPYIVHYPGLPLDERLTALQRAIAV
jgi:hypothetical protein